MNKYSLPQYEQIRYHSLIDHHSREVILVVHHYFGWAKNLNSKKEANVALGIRIGGSFNLPIEQTVVNDSMYLS